MILRFIELIFSRKPLFFMIFHKCVKIAQSVGKPDFDRVWLGFTRFTHRVIHRFCGQLKFSNKIKEMLSNVNNFLSLAR